MSGERAVRALAASIAVLAVAWIHPAARADDGIVRSWKIAGPFSSGSREALVDPLFPLSFADLDPAALPDSLPSFLAPSGKVGWVEVATETDEVPFAYEGIDWQGVTDAWGWAGSVSTGIAVGSLEIAAGGTFLIDTEGVSTVAIDGRRFLGDPYPNGAFRSPVRLDAGAHRVALRVSGGGPKSARFRVVPAPGAAILLLDDLTLPDIEAGTQAFEGMGAVPIVNLLGEDLRGASLAFGGDGTFEETVVTVPVLPPEGILKVPFAIRARAARAEGGVLHTSLSLMTADGIGVSFPCSISVKEAGASRLHTFVSDEDGSVQKYAVRPATPGAAGPLAMILSLHGASVIPLPQVDSYASKDWAIVVAPTNTRPYGFDWQDWGRRNALATRRDAMRRYGIDPARVVLTGHSMGGHGAWHVGTAHPDLFQAIAPSAGWSSFATYVPFFLRRDALACDPRLLALWGRAMAPDNPMPLLGNLAGKPVFVLHGEQDESVPVVQGRMLAQRAREAGARVVYDEIGGAIHWWDRAETPGVDCVDDARLMAFLQDELRDEPAPDSVRFVTCDLDTADRCRWVRVDAALRPFDRVEIEARVRRDGERPAVVVRTLGAAAVTLEPPIAQGAKDVDVVIDGTTVRFPWKGKPLHLAAGERGRWSRREAPATARFLGGLKAAYMSPFVLVYGTGGTAAQVAAARRLATLESQGWYLRADGYAPVVPDTSPELARWREERNLILFGMPGTNRLIDAAMPRMPVRVDAGGVEVAGHRYEGKGIGTRYVARSPWAADRLVEIVAGVDEAGLEIASGANPCYSGSGFPDFVVLDPSARRDGWTSFLAAGYWNREGTAPSGPEDAYFR